MTTYHLRNESGIEVFTGTIFPAPGGGFQPQNAVYSGFTGVTINDGAIGLVPWEGLDQGPALLDLADPANPAFLTPGVYAVSASWYADAPPTAGGFYSNQISADELGTTLTITNIYGTSIYPPSLSGWFTLVAVIEATYDDGGTLGFINLFIGNFDGGGFARTFVLSQGIVSKIA